MAEAASPRRPASDEVKLGPKKRRRRFQKYTPGGGFFLNSDAESPAVTVLHEPSHRPMIVDTVAGSHWRQLLPPQRHVRVRCKAVHI